jgi:hypothetical protein
MHRDTPNSYGAAKKGQNRTMYLSRTDSYSIEPSRQSHRSRYVESRSVSLKGLDTGFRHRLQSRDEEEVAGMERALASFHSAVAKDYGFEDAARAAEDWIEELGKVCTNNPDWRSVTTRAAHHLALRLAERHPYYS